MSQHVGASIMAINRIEKKIKLKETQLLILGYLAVILTGSFLLCLPAASRDGEWTSYIDALFTATSATCVTGLVTVDTFLKWTGFGQVVILIMIQIGGLGFMTLITTTMMFLGRKIGLYERKILMQSAGTMRLSGIVHLVRRISIGTAIFEGVGACLLATRLCPKLGFWQGLYSSVFHSVSAFCNAGYDLMGRYGAFGSLAQFSGDWIVNLTIMGLVFMGGIGFIVWSDVLDSGFNPKKFSLHTKIALYGSIALIFTGALLFWLFERNNLLVGKDAGESLLVCLFMSVTPRTAGFATVNYAAATDSSLLLTMLLMLIGGCPGGTAGGLKVTTLVVIILGVVSSARSDGDIVIGKRRLEKNLVNQALGLLAVYLAAIFAATLVMCAIEPFDLTDIGVEVFSAINTVGLSTGITPDLSLASKIILMLLMLMGRVGALSFTLAFTQNKPILTKCPVEKILIG